MSSDNSQKPSTSSPPSNPSSASSSVSSDDLSSSSLKSDTLNDITSTIEPPQTDLKNNDDYNISSSSDEFAHCPLLSLPIEILQEIILHLEVKDVLNLGATNSHMKSLLIDDRNHIWSTLFRRDFSSDDTSVPKPYDSFLDLYINGLAPFYWLKTALWIDDDTPFGDVYITKYSHEHGSLCLYKLLCRNTLPQNAPPPPNVTITHHHHVPNVQNQQQAQQQGQQQPEQQQQQQNPPQNPQQHIHTDHNNNQVVSTSVFLSSANNMTFNTRITVATGTPNDLRNPNAGNNPQQLPSDSSITIYPNNGNIVAFGPYVNLNDFINRDEQTGMWKFKSKIGALVGIFRASAIAPQNLNRSMSVWPPFKIPANDRTRNTSTNNFLGHYGSPFPTVTTTTTPNQPGAPVTTTTTTTTTTNTTQNGATTVRISRSNNNTTTITTTISSPAQHRPAMPAAMFPIPQHGNGIRFNINNHIANVHNAHTNIQNHFRSMSPMSPPSSASPTSPTSPTSGSSSSSSSSGSFVEPSPDLFRLQRFFNMERVFGKVETLSRLDEELYTATEEFPYRGVWVSGRSSEFQLFHQPTKHSLEAIKLTGTKYYIMIDLLNFFSPLFHSLTISFRWNSCPTRRIQFYYFQSK